MDMVVEWEVLEGRSALVHVPDNASVEERLQTAAKLARAMTPEGAQIAEGGTFRWRTADGGFGQGRTAQP